MSFEEHFVKRGICPFCFDQLGHFLDDVLGFPLDVYSCLRCQVDFFFTNEGIEIRFIEPPSAIDNLNDKKEIEERNGGKG